LKIAIIENDKVTNVVVGEPETLASLFDLTQSQTEETGTAWVGARWNGVKFEAQKVFESWTWNETTFDYDPPTHKPEGDYYWGALEQEWIKTPEPDEELLG